MEMTMKTGPRLRKDNVYDSDSESEFDESEFPTGGVIRKHLLDQFSDKYRHAPSMAKDKGVIGAKKGILRH